MYVYIRLFEVSRGSIAAGAIDTRGFVIRMTNSSPFPNNGAIAVGIRGGNDCFEGLSLSFYGLAGTILVVFIVGYKGMNF